MQVKKVDKPFLLIILTLIVSGFFIFYSASLGLLARDGIRLSSVMFNQAFLGLFMGSIALIIASKINYLHLRKYAFYIFIFSVFLTLLVFTPLGFEHGGAKRWLSFGSFSFQPAEFLKLGFVIYFATWLSSIKNKVGTFKFGVLPMLIMLFFVAAALLKQPDTGTFLVIFIAAMSMFVVAGAKWKHIALLVLFAIASFAAMAYFRPYIRERVETFLNPSTVDSLGAGYQVKQSLIAVGSGQIFGRGFGKSIQKFNFLPEPMGDSIFAVMSEEWGFVGGVLLISLFMSFVYRGFYIASRSQDIFGRLLVVGIVILIVSQSFINIASMLGIFPVTGMPLLFVSQGGSALMFALLEVGIILNVSKKITK